MAIFHLTIMENVMALLYSLHRLLSENSTLHLTFGGILAVPTTAIDK